MSLWDVGGKRGERRKWIHCFEDVKAVVFVISLPSLWNTLMEDPSQNEMNETLSLYEQIINSRWFKSSLYFVIYNKYDLFLDKINDLKDEFGNDFSIFNPKCFSSGDKTNKTFFQENIDMTKKSDATVKYIKKKRFDKDYSKMEAHHIVELHLTIVSSWWCVCRMSTKDL